jgi:hypothetical protein
MATVVNNPGTTTEGGSGTNFLLAVILLIAFALIMIFYGVPFLTRSVGNVGVSQAPQVQVPGKINVDVNQHQPSK